MFEKKITVQDINSALETFRAQDGLPAFDPKSIETLTLSKERDVTLIMRVDPSHGSALEPWRQTLEHFITTIEGVASASVILTAQKKTPAQPVSDPHGMNKNPPLTLPIRHIVAVASGKGGVGKSTVAFNLALRLAARGQKTGLLDADIYGPSVPRLAGVSGQKPELDPKGKLRPLMAHSLKLMSMGFLVEPEKAMIWRGPMIQTAFYQLLRDVLWGEPDAPLDILIIDMPPGTGDIQLTLSQKVPVSGAIIISTPQDLALIDARKAVAMFEKTNVPILGIVENMSFYCCPQCGHRENIFGHGGARAEAQKLTIPFLGEIPLSAQIRADSDNGVGSSDPAYDPIVEGVLGTLKTINR